MNTPAHTALDAVVVSQSTPMIGLDDNRIGSQVQVHAKKLTDDGQPVEIRVERAVLDMLCPDAWREHLPTTKEPFTALTSAVTRAKKALKEVTSTESEEANGKKVAWRRIGVSDDTLSYAMVATEVDPAHQQWKGAQVATIFVERTGRLDIVWAHGFSPEQLHRDEAARVRHVYGIERSYIRSDDMRRFVNKVLKESKAVRLGTSVAHIALAPHDEVFLELAPMLDAAGFEVVINEVMERGGQRLSGAVQRGMLGQIEQLRAEVDRLVSEQRDPDGKGHRLETFDARLDRARELQAVASMYGSLIGAATETVDGALLDVTGSIKEMMTEMLGL